MRKVVALVSIIFLAGCLADRINTLEITTTPKKLSKAEITLVETLVAEQTREPEAVRFRFLTGYQASNGHTIICGEANGKNAYGGYVGYSQLWVRMDGKKLKVASFGKEQSKANLIWCNNAKAGKVMIQPD